MQFKIAKVPNAGCSEDGREIMARVRNDRGEIIDLITSYQVFEEVINAFNEAQSTAHDKRRARGDLDESVPAGDTTTQPVSGFRYVVADDRSHMLLQIQTPNGRLDIRIDQKLATSFREATNRNYELLASPPRKSSS